MSLVLFWALWLGAGALIRMLLARSSLGASAAGRLARRPADAWRPACRWCSPAWRAWRSWAAAVAAEERPDSHVYEYRPATAMASGAGAGPAARRGRRPIASGRSISGPSRWSPAIRFLLVRHGDRVMAPGSFPRLGTYYELRGHPYRWVVYLSDGTRAAAHMRLVSRVAFRSPWGEEVFSAWVRRVGEVRTCAQGRARDRNRKRRAVSGS